MQSDRGTANSVAAGPLSADGPGAERGAVASLRDMCARHSRLSAVAPVADGRPDWVIDEGRLRHCRVEYFSIGVCEPEAGRFRFMLEQQEQALVMLLMADIAGVESVLLGIRTEPGLIGLTNLTTTVQSTASNYLRRHGGKATPFIEFAEQPDAFGVVISDTDQFDWGGHYVYKTKRFLILKVTEAFPAPPGYVWVATSLARSLLLEDDLITCDLRVALPYLWDSATDSTRLDAIEDRPAPIDPDRSGQFTVSGFPPDYVDSVGNRIAFFRMVSETREVPVWVQPLLVPARPEDIRLPFLRSGSQRLFGVHKRTQPGLLGRRLWFPAPAEGAVTVRRVAASAEGGRFWRHRINVSLLEIGDPRRCGGDDVEWLREDELADLVVQPLRTSLELRMAWSIVSRSQSRR